MREQVMSPDRLRGDTMTSLSTFCKRFPLDLNSSSNPSDDVFASTRFVLVEPSHPGNVGAAARALKTMGFSRLVLVAPRVAQVQTDPEAVAMASGADDVLASARIVPTLADALVGIQWSVAMTARVREYGPPQLTPRAAAGAACHHA